MSPSNSVKSHVDAVCDNAISMLPEGRGRQGVQAVRDKLAEPLQVTVAGGVSSGKSTLVNALLGQRIAAVDAGECTRVVTRFRYSHHERAEVELHDGTTHTVALDGGSLPAQLGVPTDSVRQVVVHLSNSGLTQLAIVDTPGLNTVTEANQDRTVGFLGLDTGGGKAAQETAASIGQADALIFLMPHLRKSDADVLGAFRDLYRGTGLSAFNAVAVLSKVDQLAPTGDPMEVAAPIAARIAADARGLVSGVMPVIGLLAETAATARLTEHDARALSVLAGYGDDLDREDLVVTPQSFLTFEGPEVSPEHRRRLLDLAGMYGIRLALELIDGGAKGASPLLRAFEQRSGFAPLRSLVLDQIGAQAELIKASNALCDLRRLSYLRVDDPEEGTALRSLRSPLDRIELDPALHHLRVIQVLQDTSSGDMRLPEPLLDDLERLATNTNPEAQVGVSRLDEVADAALVAAGRWGAFANDPRRNPLDARRARAVKEAYEMLWSDHARNRRPA